MAAEGDPVEPDVVELIRDGLQSLRAEGDTEGLLRTARSILYWAERMELADPGPFDQELALFAEPDLQALRCAIRQGEHVLRAPSGDWQTKAMALLAELDKHPILSGIAARGRADLAAAGLEVGQPSDLRCWWSPEDSPSVGVIDLHGHKSPVTGCCFLPGPRQLATCDQNEVLVWDIDREALVAVHRDHDGDEVMDACGPHSGAWLVTVNVQGGRMGMTVGNKAALKLWDLRAGGAPRTLTESKDGPYGCELSPDEKWLVTHHANHTVHFWNTATWEHAGVISGESDPVVITSGTPTRYAPDGSWFAQADVNGNIGLWDPETLGLRLMLDGHPSGVTNLAVPDDASWLASTDGGEVCIWDTRQGTLLVRVDASGTGCSGLVADPAGRWVAACFGPDALRVIPVTRQLQHDQGTGGGRRWPERLPCVAPGAPEIFVGSVCRASQDGRRVLSVTGMEEEHRRSVSSWHVVRCWDTATGHRVSGPARRPGGLPTTAMPRSGAWAALVDDYEIGILDPETTDALAEFDYSPYRVRSVDFGGRTIAAGFESGMVRMYRPGPRSSLVGISGRAPADLAGCFAPPHGRSVIAWSGWRSRQAFVLDSSSGAVRHALQGRNTGVFLNQIITSCCHSPDGSWVATADDNGTVRVWDPETGHQLAEAAGQDGEDFLASDCASARWMATVAKGGRLHIRDRRGVRRREIRLAGPPQSGCAGTDSWLAVEHETSISIWNPLTGAHLRDLPGRFGACPLPAVGGDDVPLLACTTPDGQVTMLNPVTGESYGTFSTPAGLKARDEGVRVRAAHPNLRWVIVSDSFGGLDAWDVRKRALIRVSRGYDTPVVACRVNRDGTMLAVAEQTGLLRVWDTATWRPAARVRTGGPLADCCWSPDATRLYAVGNRGAYCYELPPDPTSTAPAPGQEYTPWTRAIVLEGLDTEMAQHGYVLMVKRYCEELRQLAELWRQVDPAGWCPWAVVGADASSGVGPAGTWPVARSGSRVDGQLEGGVVVGLEGGVLVAQRAAVRVVQHLPPGHAAPHVVRLPPGHKLLAFATQAVHQFFEGWVAGPQVMRGPELRDHPARFTRPARPEPLAGRRVGEHEDQDVAVLLAHLAEVGDDVGRGRVPAQHVPAAAGDVGGLVQALDQALDGPGHALPGEGPVPRAAGQRP